MGAGEECSSPLICALLVVPPCGRVGVSLLLLGLGLLSAGLVRSEVFQAHPWLQGNPGGALRFRWFSVIGLAIVATALAFPRRWRLAGCGNLRVWLCISYAHVNNDYHRRHPRQEEQEEVVVVVARRVGEQAACRRQLGGRASSARVASGKLPHDSESV